MNEFLEQFLIESREYVEQATADLLALEKSPGDRARLDSAFRAFHTLKGGAGIVDFPAMADAVHAAEEALMSARSGALAITARLVGDGLACLDQVAQWLDGIERTGLLPPPAAAVAAAALIVARFGRSAAPPSKTLLPAALARPAASVSEPERRHWLDDLLARRASLRPGTRVAVRYAPDRECFFNGIDPCRLIAALPRLLSLDLETGAPWPPLDAMDPFACNLVLIALCGSSREAVAAALADVIGQCEIRAIEDNASIAAPSTPPLSTAAREVLEAQIALIDSTGTQGAAGRIASAGAAAAAVLRHLGRPAEAAGIARTTAACLDDGDFRSLREAIAEVVALRAPADIPAPLPAAHDQEVTVRSLRVDATRIDALVNLTGELTVAKNSLGHAARLAQEGDPAAATMLRHRFAVLERLVGDLQRSVLGMRVLPLRHVFQRFPRMLREIADELGKPVTLLVEGGETEADKVIVEILFEPLLHVLRNAIGHGIESAPVRAARGKPPVASIRLRALRESGHVIVEVVDDGGGIDVAKVRQVAAKRAMMSEDALAALTDDEAINLIFEPGFSTASEVTSLSGRGVGLDAVRHAVGRFGGTVAVESLAGVGTTIRCTLPFSVMMTRVMVVAAGGQRFGIPLDTVVETLRIGSDRISTIGAAEAFVLRNRTLPLLSLAASLGLPGTTDAATEATVVVIRVDGQYGALRVDQVGERMEVMLKPLDGLLAGMRGIAGSTLLGDGTVLLILDIGGIFQ